MPQSSTQHTDEGAEQAGPSTSGQADPSPFDAFRRDLGTYIEKRTEWLLLVLTEPVAFLAAKLLQMLLGVLVIAIALLFVWIALALAMSQWVGSLVSGFLLSAIPLLLLSWWLLARAPGYLWRRFQNEIMGALLDHAGKRRAESKRSREDAP